VCARLAQLDITPVGVEPSPTGRAPAADLEGRVRRRAEQIRRGSRVALRAISSADAG
jgi:hypothetical protein